MRAGRFLEVECFGNSIVRTDANFTHFLIQRTVENHSPRHFFPDLLGELLPLVMSRVNLLRQAARFNDIYA